MSLQLQFFEFSKGDKGYFITDLNTPGNYLPDSDSLLGYIYDENGTCIKLTTVPYNKLRPAALPINFGNYSFNPNQVTEMPTPVKRHKNNE